MFISLVSRQLLLRKDCTTYTNKQPTTEKPIPWVVGVIHVVGIEEDRPLISDDLELSIPKLLLNPGLNVIRPWSEIKLLQKCTRNFAIHSQQGKGGRLSVHAGTLDRTSHYEECAG